MSCGSCPEGRPILVVDDSEDDLVLTRLALREAGWSREVECACDAEAALARLSSAEPKPCLVLLDLRMPRIDGLEVLKSVRADPRLAGICVVVFTSSLLDDDRRKAAELGCDLFLQKPVDYRGSVLAARRVLEFAHA